MSKNEHFTVKQSNERLFVPVYHDFLDSKLLNGKEKTVFIMLKRYLAFRKDVGEVYPTIDTICNQCEMSKPTVIKILKQLETKGVLKIEQRGLNKPNLYTLYDLEEIWSTNSKKEIIKAINDSEVERLAELLREKGYYVSKEKESVSATYQSTDTNPQQFSNTIINNNTLLGTNSQDDNSFSRQMINEIYDFNILIENNQGNISLLDAIMELLLEVLNTRSKTIRVNKEDKQATIVKSRFLKLNYMHIQYVIDSITQQSNVKAIRSYLITSLYNSYTTIDVHYSTMINNDK